MNQIQKRFREIPFFHCVQIVLLALLSAGLPVFVPSAFCGGYAVTWVDVTSNINGAAVNGDTTGGVTYWVGANCAGTNAPQHLYQFTLSASAQVTITTCGGVAWDSELILWDDTNSQIACHDDMGVTCVGYGGASRIIADLAAGTYRLIMTGYNDDDYGPYSLWITTNFPLSTLGKPILAPVPAQRGEKVCMFYTKIPTSSEMEIYNANGEKLSAVSTMEANNHCWDTSKAAPGVYFVKIVVTYADGKKETIWRKAVVIP